MSRWAMPLVLVAAVGGAAAVLVLRGGNDRASQPETLLRPGTLATFRLADDLDGDGVKEVVVAARARDAPAFGFPAQFLDVYRSLDGEWQRILDGTGPAPAGAGAPRRMLDGPTREFTARMVDSVETVDFAPDGGRELVVSVLTAGATEGPLEVWVLALEDGSFRTEVYERTARGGDLAVDGDRLILEFGVYRPGDPGCCPSLREHLVIGFDPESGGIAVLRRVRRPVES